MKRDYSAMYPGVKPLLTAIDNQVMSEANSIDIDLCADGLNTWINENFQSIITKTNTLSYEQISNIMNKLDAEIPGIPRANKLFEKIYSKNNFIKIIVDILIVEAVKYVTNVDGNTIDTSRLAKLDHPFKTLNTLPYIMKNFIISRSIGNILVNKSTKFKCKLEGHTDKINAIYLDDNTILSCSNDKTIRVWDIKSGKCVHILTHDKAVKYFDANDDSSQLVLCDLSRTVSLWDIQSEKKILNYEFTNRMHHVKWMSDCLIVFAKGEIGVKNMVIKDSDFIFTDFQCTREDYSLNSIKNSKYKIYIDNNDIMLTLNKSLLSFVTKALDNSENNLEKLLNLKSSDAMTTLSELEGNKIRIVLDDKIKELVNMNTMLGIV